MGDFLHSLHQISARKAQNKKVKMKFKFETAKRK